MRRASYVRSVLEALLVTFLWSTSWVLIKWGLVDIPPLTFAGLRYGLAVLFLLPGLWKRREEVRPLGMREWSALLLLGIVFYTLTQGGQFLTLRYLEAIPFSLFLSFSPIVVAIAGVFALNERLRGLQWLGISLVLAGALLYFVPSGTWGGSALGVGLAIFTVLANGGAALLGRAVNRAQLASPLVVTAISMGTGAILLLAVGAGAQGIPPLSLRSWAIIGWLAFVNTALAFTLWNHSLRSLTAAQSSVINNTMLIQIAVLAWLFLGETLGWLQVLGLLIVAAGTFIVQLRRSKTETRHRE